MLKEVLLACILLISVSKCDIFHFKSTLSCTEKDNCGFYQPEIWVKSVGNNNNSIPNDEDSVYLIGNNINGSTLIIPEESHILLELLYISGNFTLVVINNTQVYGNENNVEPIVLILDENSSLRIVSVGLKNTGSTQLQAGSVLTINSASVSLILSSPGTGSINVTNSDIKLSNSHLSEINETVAISGNSSVKVDGIQFTNNNLFIGPGFISFTIQWMELKGNFFIPGEFLAQDSHFETRGNISVSGGISVFGGTFLATGVLTTGSPIVLDVGKVSGANFVLQSPLILTTPTLLSRSSCTVATQGPIALLGSVINEGIFYLNKFLDPGANQIVSIFGNYTQVEGGTQVAYLAKGVSTSVNAEYVTLSGMIAYIAHGKELENTNRVIVQSTNVIFGKFTGILHSYVDDNPDLEGMKIVYFPASVALAIGKTSTHGRSYVIMIVVPVLGFVVVFVVGIIIKWASQKWARKKSSHKLLLPQEQQRNLHKKNSALYKL